MVSGVLTLNRASFTVGEKGWGTDTRYPNVQFYVSINDFDQTTPPLCTSYKYVTGNAWTQNQDKTFGIAGAYIIVVDNDYTTSAAFKTAMGSTRFVYELSTPITVQLSSQIVATLTGANTVWADTGNITLGYVE